MKRHERGTSLIETTWALGLMTLILFAAVSFIANSFQGTKHNRDKAFAAQKAMAILEELKGLVERKTGGNINLLDSYDDGVNKNPLLTTQTGIADPAHPSSGNIQTEAGVWRYERQVSVQKILSLQTNDIRLVTVRVFALEAQGHKMLLAEVAGVIRTIADKYPPTQVYDVYCIATSQVPGWWVYMANLIPFVENAISELQARNPGLEFRTHWIRNLGYGRDKEYVPFINSAAVSTADINSVYYYPGKMPTGSSVEYYYVPTQFRGRINIDGAVHNDFDATSNPYPYALADQYNHNLRYPEEKALWNQRVGAGLEAEPTWRLLLDDMILRPDLYKNSILINLHGELLPFPPVRNYSDPAKDPESHPNIRVVTHPERLWYANTDSVRLRVYSYLTDPAAVGAPDHLHDPISIVLKGVGDHTGLTVQAISGGIDSDADGIMDAYVSGTASLFPIGPHGMYYDIDSDGTDTIIKLYNSPLKTPCKTVSSSCTGGLPTTRRLYGLDYIPTPLAVTSGTAFSKDLTVSGDLFKNTARWIITIPAALMSSDAMWTYETRIDDDLTTGVLFPTGNQPANLSTTFTWRGTSTWAFGDGTLTNLPHIPMTERFQYLGDPRHNPYADNKETFDATHPLGTGYNRYFSSLGTGVTTDWGYPSGTLANGWSGGGGSMEIEVNRAFQTLREGLLRTNSLWTTMTGWSYYYMGIGNEIGYDAANGFSNSIPVSTKPYNGSSGSRYEQTITSDITDAGVKLIKEGGSTNPWWGMSWLGEMYPDNQYAYWVAHGNLPTGSGSGYFTRVLKTGLNGMSGVPSGFFFNSVRRTQAGGCGAYMWVGSSTSSTFNHSSNDGATGTLQTPGREISTSFHFPIPDSILISRPFNTNRSNSASHLLTALYSVPSETLATAASATFYNSSASGLQGSQLLSVTGTGTRRELVVVNGIDRTISNGSAFLGRWSFLTLIQGFLLGGLLDTPRIGQLPRVQVTAPNDLTDLSDPSTITVTWSPTWKRWDGQKYTSGFSDSFAETSTVSYAVIYSQDSGKTWRFVQDRTTALPGVRPSSTYLISGTTTYAWSTPTASYPSGSYLVRVEAFLDDRSQHYSYHQQKIFIKR